MGSSIFTSGFAPYLLHTDTHDGAEITEHGLKASKVVRFKLKRRWLHHDWISVDMQNVLQASRTFKIRYFRPNKRTQSTCIAVMMA